MISTMYRIVEIHHHNPRGVHHAVGMLVDPEDVMCEGTSELYRGYHRVKTNHWLGSWGSVDTWVRLEPVATMPVPGFYLKMNLIDSPTFPKTKHLIRRSPENFRIHIVQLSHREFLRASQDHAHSNAPNWKLLALLREWDRRFEVLLSIGVDRRLMRSGWQDR